MLVDGDPARSLEVSEITDKIAPHELQGRGARQPNPSDKAIKTFGAQCIEVEVDIETGEVTVLRVATAHEIGRIVNPTLVDSQVIGGITQGLGYGLLEERIVDTNLGVVLNPNLEEYKVPTIADIPGSSMRGSVCRTSRQTRSGRRGWGSRRWCRRRRRSRTRCSTRSAFASTTRRSRGTESLRHLPNGGTQGGQGRS